MLCLVCAGVQGAGEEAPAGERVGGIVWMVFGKASPKETLKNLLCPSPGLLKSLAMIGESESYVDQIRGFPAFPKFSKIELLIW